MRKLNTIERLSLVVWLWMTRSRSLMSLMWTSGTSSKISINLKLIITKEIKVSLKHHGGSMSRQMPSCSKLQMMMESMRNALKRSSLTYSLILLISSMMKHLKSVLQFINKNKVIQFIKKNKEGAVIKIHSRSWWIRRTKRVWWAKTRENRNETPLLRKRKILLSKIKN